MTTPPTFARMIIHPQLKNFLDQHPNVEIAIEISNSQLDYKTGEYDLDIRFGTGRHVGRESRILLDEVIFPVASPAYIEEHRLETPKDLKHAQFLRSRLEPWKPWFVAAGLDCKEPDEGHRFEDLSLLYHAAADGLGIALACASVARFWRFTPTVRHSSEIGLSLLCSLRAGHPQQAQSRQPCRVAPAVGKKVKRIQQHLVRPLTCSHVLAPLPRQKTSSTVMSS